MAEDAGGGPVSPLWWCAAAVAVWCLLGAAVGPVAFPILLVTGFAWALHTHHDRNGRH